MGLPWVRLDSHIATHDKMFALLSDPSTAKWQAAASYMFGIAWSGGQGTDGFIPRLALGAIHGTQKTARLLEKYGLWDEATAGWQIRNYAERQLLSSTADEKARLQRLSSGKANCARWHGDSCWANGRCNKEKSE